MIISDRIYGRHTVKSPILLDLIKSKSMQRLHGIGQMGQPKASDPRKYLFSRFEHSVGVMLLLKILGATEEEQVAGLLHDVSHTAFSHTIDSVLKRGKSEDFQDSQHEKFILKSEIPPILKKHKLNPKRIYDYKHFTLLEQGLPALCADRVDYALRESPLSITKKCLPKLTTNNGEIVFTDTITARIFADRFLVLQETSWGGSGPVIREQLFTKALQYALAKKIITIDDFWQDDDFILKKLKIARNSFLEKSFKTMKLKSFEKASHNTFLKYKKFRFVDPDVIIRGKTAKLSKLDPVFLEKLKKAQVENEKGVVIPIISEGD